MGRETMVYGEAGEHRMMSELLLRGHNPFKASLDYGIDIILENGIKIQVKTAREYNKNAYKWWTFSFRTSTTQKGRQQYLVKSMENIDFVILWAIDYGFFIIPANIIKSSVSISKGGKWDKYKDAWYLLEEKGLMDQFYEENDSKRIEIMSTNNIGHRALGEAGDHYIMSELLLRGHNPFKASLETGTDIILESGIKIQAKSATQRESYGHKCWQFSFTTTTTKDGQRVLLQKHLRSVDFVILWAIGYGLFIIPTKLLSSHLSIFSGGKWDKYKDAWHLLEEQGPIEQFLEK